MQSTNMFEQITQGLGDPKKFGKWLEGAWTVPGNTEMTAVPGKAWIGSVEGMLQGAEKLREMQLEAIHNTQQRISGLAKSLGGTHNQAETLAALQTFAQENVQDALKYWTAYREIVQGAELDMLDGVAKANAKTDGEVAESRRRTPRASGKRA